MTEQDDPVAPDQDHHTTTMEKGRFCLAHCTCGWHGPARRARSLARADAEDHAGAVTGGHPQR
ncbi:MULTISPECIES: hypothetical protein [unclassified Streptomyces]|uniref:hypothetical protein n=1 Tax=unclassified Streptomyces TaxID=2593676 RepID=UPI001F040C0A|nr:MULTISPECIES: hypothetical protein [unclassified Streptomyces]MCH0566128.1 hypothetical protein [Streptomyces sp. MUM 2J]MCH0572341.1 hypothetical protein [Streptomyces sp. MUM 136J]